MLNKNAILIHIIDEDTQKIIDGSIAATILDLECGSCFETKIMNYDNIITYSDKIELRIKASDMLRNQGYKVFELETKFVQNGIKLINDMNELLNDLNNEKVNFDRQIDQHREIKLKGTSSTTSIYEKEDRIKRIYGEVFSYGDSPEESAQNFLLSNSEILNVNYNDLVFQNLQPVMYNSEEDQYKFTAVNYIQYFNDINVYGTRLILLVRNEDQFPLVLASVDLRDLTKFQPLIDEKSLNPDEGIVKAIENHPNLDQFTEPELVVWAGLED